MNIRHATFVLLSASLIAVTGCGKTSKIICPWAEGGGTDQITRHMAAALEEETGTRFIAFNKTGGSGATGHQAGADARPDGRTLAMITVELNTMHQLGVTDLTYKDFRPLIQLNADPAAIIVLQDAPWSNLSEFLDHIRANPDTLKMSGTATTGIWDLARIGLLQTAGIDHGDVTWVPSKGAAPSIEELLGGHVDAVCCSVPEAAPQIEAGKLRVLAVLADEPLEEYPDLPTAKAQGVDWSAVGWRGLAVPKGTPDKTFNELAAACKKIVESDSFKKFMNTNGFRIEIRGPDEFAKFLSEQDKQWQPVIATYQGK
jgi:tripartite-type tricarboxylate transporter receptor subunit TctC